LNEIPFDFGSLVLLKGQFIKLTFIVVQALWDEEKRERVREREKLVSLIKKLNFHRF
jgi:hypothetical protein